MPYGVLSLNMPEVPLAADEVIIKNYSENADWAPKVLEQLQDMLIPTGREVDGLPIYRIKAEDPTGLELL